MQKKLLVLTLVLVSFFVVALPTFAANPTPTIPPITQNGPSNATFDAVNPLKITQTNPALVQQFSTPGGIVSRILLFSFPIAGLILFVMSVWGGFEILAGAHNKKSMDAGRQRVTAAIVGFLLLFSSYWIAQIVEYIFGLSIL